MPHRAHRVFLALLALLLATHAVGCASASRGAAPAAAPGETVADEAVEETAPLAPGIYEVSSGEALAPEALFDRLAKARVVVVGESHDDPGDHAVQAAIYEAMLARHGEEGVALGMEMFQRPFQGPLDAYVAGEIDEAEMLEATEWTERWGFDPALYRPLWRLALEARSPIVALNVRRELTKRVAAVGVEGLSAAERADLPRLDLADPAYRAWMREIFEAHGMAMEPERFERFFQAQVLWDEAMAETAAAYLTAHPDVAQMVVVAGRGHVEGGRGIPPRLRRRMTAPGAVVTVVPVRPDGGPLDRLREQALADYVWVRRD